MNNKISGRRKTKRHIKRHPSQTLAQVDCKNQLRNKMVKGKTNDKSQTNDVNVICKRREKFTKGKNCHRKLQHMKMG
jgi:hypothetical protein